VKVCLACQSRFEAADWRCPSCGEAPPSDGRPIFSQPLSDFSERFDADVFRELAELEFQSPWFQVRNRAIQWLLGTRFPQARSFFEIGCGSGCVLAGLRDAFPALALSGGDPFPLALDIARRRLPDVELFQMDARQIPFDGEFDAIGAFDVIEHVDEDEEVLSELSRALRPGGGALLAVPQHRWLWSAADDFARHRRRYERDELVDKVRRAGFRVVFATSFVTLLAPVMALARLLQRNLEAYDPRDELRPRWLVSSMMERGLEADLALITRGKSLPFGGTLLLAAEKPRAR
jgi:SAM-dependent methyltransferase